MGINTQIEVTDLHKSFGKNEVLKELLQNLKKGMSYVLSVPQVLENRLFLEL